MIDVPRITETLNLNEAPYEEVRRDKDENDQPIILVGCKSPKAAAQCARALQNDDELGDIFVDGSFVEVAL